jgi:hypothetical protein
VLLSFSVLSLGACATVRSPHPSPSPDRHILVAGKTHWSVGPNEALDALCLLNLLRGEAFYVGQHKEAFAEYAPLLGAAEKRALGHLGELFRRKNHLMGPYLTLVYSAGSAETLADLTTLTNDEQAWQKMLDVYRRSPQGEGDDAQVMSEARAEIRVLLAFLHREDFPSRWRRDVLPQVQKTIDRDAAKLGHADVIAWDEEMLGRELHIETLRADVLGYVSPHGVRVVGWHFLTDVAFPAEVTIKTALHELLHPPFPRVGEIDQRLSVLEADPFFQRLLKEHDPSFGYLDARDLTEEDCAEAIDVAVSSEHGLLTDLRTGATVGIPEFVRTHDDGFHVLAFLLATRLHARDRAHFPGFERMLLESLRDGTLMPLEPVFRNTPGAFEIAALKGKR